jgi:peptidoglycan/LPS O-acetylase OafA/YrhL
LLDNRDATNYFKVFYVRRICRIFPIYYLNLLLFFALLASGWGSISPWLFDRPLPFLSYATFTQNISAVYFLVYFGFPPFGAYGLAATWSLAVAEVSVT